MRTFYRQHKMRTRLLMKVVLILLLILIFISGIYYFLSHYRVENVYVDGNVHYSDEDIKNFVMDGPLGNNSLFLSLKYKNSEIKDVPFVDAIQVDVLSHDSIRVVVYEKALAGFVEYLGKYMYFDKDGTVVESSNVRTDGIVEITGLDFGYVVLGKPLPIEDPDIFRQVLYISQLLSKYELKADKIYYDRNYNITVYFKNLRVNLGDDKLLDEKIMLLPQMFQTVGDKKGVLNMQNYTGDTGIVSFEPDD